MNIHPSRYQRMIQTNHMIVEERRPHLVVVVNENSCCQIIDFATPYGSSFEEKESGKSKNTRTWQEYIEEHEK